MLPEDLAARHPFLYHVTEPGAWESIKQRGLLSTSCLLDLFDITGGEREGLETKRRAAAIPLDHPLHGRVILNDNLPLTEHALATCLEDGLTPAEWLRLLNSRVFFWASKEGLNRLLGARLNRTRPREIIVVDTLSLAKTHADRIELCPINSGSTLRKAARRGLTTFTPLLRHSFQEWRTLRERQDHIHEVTVRDHVLDIAQHVIEVFFHLPEKSSIEKQYS